MHAQLDYTCTTMFIILYNLVIRNLPPNILLFWVQWLFLVYFMTS